jgi:hypothetical protein
MVLVNQYSYLAQARVHIAHLMDKWIKSMGFKPFHHISRNQTYTYNLYQEFIVYQSNAVYDALPSAYNGLYLPNNWQNHLVRTSS